MTSIPSDRSPLIGERSIVPTSGEFEFDIDSTSPSERDNPSG
jgi:hypothetical protein